MTRAIWLSTGLALLLAAAADAQQQTTITAYAVVEEALVATAIRNLEFPELTPGVNVTLTPDEAQTDCAGCAAGKWEFTGISDNPLNRYAVITFEALPVALDHASGAQLPISWGGAGQACLSKGGVQYYCYPLFSPSQGSSHSFEINLGGPATPPGLEQRSMQLYLGGTVSPALSQRAGHYQGLARVTFAYSTL